MTPTAKRVVRESTEIMSGRRVIVIVGPGNLIGFRYKRSRRGGSVTMEGDADGKAGKCEQW
jgi:hypothetical protein